MAKPKNTSSSSKQKGMVRIIAGKHRGRKLPVLLADGLRPTTDRVKETLFNWLMHDIIDKNCLDCYAGAGSLGFEAMSRGASKVTFIEKLPSAAKQLQQNAAILKAGNCVVFSQDCLVQLASLNERFDVVFIDPPFRKSLIAKTAALLEENQLLSNSAFIYLECEKELATSEVPVNWRLLKEKTAGQVSYRLYQKQE